MAVQTDFLDVGFFVSGGDYRNSTLTGTTLSGPNGSGQFLVVTASTTVEYTVNVAGAGSTLGLIGVLQNKPSTGVAADVKIHGVSKVVLGSTTGVAGTVTFGSPLAISSVSSGCVSFASSTAAYRVGMSLQGVSTAGTVFSAVLYGPGGGGVGWLLNS